jgi:hypothetical protein
LGLDDFSDFFYQHCCVDDDKGPKPGTGECVPKGIYSSNPAYLCDPPEWKEKTEDSIIHKIFRFFGLI